MSTFREQAERIVFEARNLTHESAVDLIALRLEQLHIEGERAGIEAARQSINAMSQPEAA